MHYSYFHTTEYNDIFKIIAINYNFSKFYQSPTLLNFKMSISSGIIDYNTSFLGQQASICSLKDGSNLDKL